jgi:hypothetical protein
VVRYDNVQVLTEIEAVLQDLLSVMDEQLVDSLRSHPPGPLLKKGEEAIEQSLHVVVSRLSQMCMG